MRPLLLMLTLPWAAVVFAADSETPKFGKLSAGTNAPEFSVTALDGAAVKLADFKDKVLILNFWATNRRPADMLENAFAQYRSLGVEVMGVCVNATRAEFDAWVKRHKSSVTYALAWDPAGKSLPESVAQKHFGVGVFPATGVVDRSGKIIGGFVGFGAATPAVLRGFLRDAGVAIPADKEPARPPPPPPREDRTLKPGTVAPDFSTLGLDGRTVKLSDFAGKIVVLDFWATWCGPCIAAMPHSQEVAAATKSQGVVILAACTSDTRANFETWLRANGTKYPDLVFTNDPNGRDKPETYAERASAKLYGVSGIPCQFVIDRDGKIAEVITGFGPGDTRLDVALARLGVKGTSH